MFYHEYDTKTAKGKVFVIDNDQVPRLEEEIRKKISSICYGEEVLSGVKDDRRYKITCRELTIRFSEWKAHNKEKQVYGAIAELIMHITVPQILGDNFESISVLLSSHDRDIKHGFDLNFLENEKQEIWFGEVKSSIVDARNNLISKAKKGLLDFFNNVNSGGRDDTSNRWDAAIAEAMLQVSSNKIKNVKQILVDSRNSIITNNEKQNAILMTMNYDNSPFSIEDFNDIIKKIDKYGKERIFKNFIIISASKETYDDLVAFIEKEGKDEE